MMMMETPVAQGKQNKGDTATTTTTITTMTQITPGSMQVFPHQLIDIHPTSNRTIVALGISLQSIGQ